MARSNPQRRSVRLKAGGRDLHYMCCRFCGYWARYWKKLTGDRIDYKTYQEVATQYPTIPLVDFQKAVQYIPPDGRHASAAEASFLTLSHARGKGIWLALYRKLPGFAAVSERMAQNPQRRRIGRPGGRFLFPQRDGTGSLRRAG